MKMRRLGILIGWLILSLSATLVAAQQEVVKCGDVYETSTSDKVPLDISNLPQPAYSELVNPNRTIGFVFPDGSLAMVATPVSADCTGVVNEAEVRFAGTVWTLDGQNVTNTIVVAIDISQNNAYLLDENLALIESASPTVTSMSVPAQAVVKPQADVSIGSQGVCFILNVNEEFARYCIAHDLLSVQSTNPDLYAQTLSDPINNAAGHLRETFGMDFEVNADAGISEIEDAERIKACIPGNSESVCTADIIGAPIVQSSQPQIGLLVVLQTQTQGDFVLNPGEYVIAVNAEQIPDFSSVVESNESYELTLTGLTNEGEKIEGVTIPSVVAPFISSEDYGTAEIVGMKFIFWCICGECR